MSSNNPDRSSDSPRYRSADEIVRSILDDRVTTADISPSGELLRAIERFHSDRHGESPRGDRPRDSVRHRAPQTSSRVMSSESNSDSPRRYPQDSQPAPAPRRPNPTYVPAPRAPYTTLSFTDAPSLPPLRSMSYRRTSQMSGQGSSSGGRPGRHRTSDRHGDSHLGSESQSGGHEVEDLRTAIRDLSAASREFSAARRHLQPDLESRWSFSQGPDSSSMSQMSPSSFPSPPSQAHDHAEESRRTKRRKLDSDRLAPSFKGFRYGKYGQVEPGQLTMEIISCDGGIYSDDGASYGAENILKNDSSVYCTKGNRCNIVLRHQGATVFTLKELVIKAPRNNYTSPVQEGMIFISMSSDEILARTAQYQIQYLPPRSSPRRVERETQPLAPILSIRHNEDGTTMTRAQIRARRLYNIGMDDEDNDLRTAQIPTEFNVTPPPFNVTTECDDDDSDEATPRANRSAPNRIGALPFESESDDGGGFSNLDDVAALRDLRRRNRSLQEAQEAAQIATQEAVRAVGGEMMVPHAKFFIERDKSKCTINFDPPVSGRFILLKMWSPQYEPTGNIDIQAVVAKGFAGPRYFPAVELM